MALAFEASCAGGIPIIRALCDGLIANRIDAIYGIVNGTCNYILTAMTQRGQSYAQALAEAQQAGLAEADPTLDVSGTDSAHKLAILAALAFGAKIDLAAIPVEGIDRLEPCDVAFGGELGYVVKLLAIAQRQEEGVSLRVRPAFITKEHPLAWVSGPVQRRQRLRPRDRAHDVLRARRGRHADGLGRRRRPGGRGHRHRAAGVRAPGRSGRTGPARQSSSRSRPSAADTTCV